MTKKIILSLIVILLLAGGAAWYYFFVYASPTNKTLSGTLTETFPSIFPSSGDSSGGEGSIDDSEQTGLGAASTTSGRSTQSSSRLSRVTEVPVADIAAFGVGSSTVIYGERTTGHLFEIDPFGEVSQISNTTIPGIYNLSGAKNKKATWTFVRYFKNNQPQTFLVNFQPATSTASSTNTMFTNPNEESDSISELRGGFLPTSIDQISISPDQTGFAYTEPTKDQTRIVTTDFELKKPIIALTSPLKEWRLGWISTSTLLLTTRPGGDTPGFSYSWDPKTKKLTRIIDNVLGLMALPSPDGKQLLYSGSSQDSTFLALYNLKKQTVTRLTLTTVVDKCVWTHDSQAVYCGAPTSLPAALYPDQWFSGEVSLEDKIWKINTLTQTSQLVLDPRLSTPSLSLDTAKIVLNQNEDHLYFLNKKDSSLWSLNLAAGF